MNTPNSSARRMLCLAAAATMTFGGLVAAAPVSAQLTVFDPTNYGRNVLTAARALEQVNNQLRSLQNEAAMLLNQAKNLSRIDFPELAELRRTMQEIDSLMNEAQGLTFGSTDLDRQFEQLFPGTGGVATGAAQASAARARLDTARAAYRQTMTVQSRIVAGIAADADTLQALAARSQGAQGALGAQQATNQLLALGAKQQLQIQSLLAAQFRAEAVEAARRAQAEADARAATRRFLGDGRAYTPPR